MECKYTILYKLGHGTFGEVFKAQSKDGAKQIVAVKTLLADTTSMLHEGLAKREIKILQSLRHENIVRLVEAIRERESGRRCLIFEFCEYELSSLLSNCFVSISIAEVKGVLLQLLGALEYVHERRVLHRDVKPANVLITAEGVLKLADFGLSRVISQDAGVSYSTNIGSLWYRAPELLLGLGDYGPAVDVWAAGCIMGEMWTRLPLMRGRTALEQLQLVTHACGDISPQAWPGVERSETYRALVNQGSRGVLCDMMSSFGMEVLGVDLIHTLLSPEPSRRGTATSAREHAFFSAWPVACSLQDLVSRHAYCLNLSPATETFIPAGYFNTVFNY